MPVKGNQFRSNSFRDEERPRGSGRERLVKEKAESLPKFTFNNGRVVKILGLFFLVLSLYFMVAFCSYLFTWEEDQSYVLDVNGGWSNLFKTSEELAKSGVQTPIVENWLGKFGALLSHQFIYEWFGVASFIFIAILFIIGYRLLFKVHVVSISKALGYSFFLLIFISLTLAFFHSFTSDYPHFLEGEFGFWTNRLLQAQIGNAGIAGLLGFAALTVLIIAYNIDFKIPAREKKTVLEVPAVPDEIELEDEIKSEPVEFPLNNRRREKTLAEEKFAEGSESTTLKQERIVPPVETTFSAADETVVPRTVPLETAAAAVALNVPKFVHADSDAIKPHEPKPEPELTIERTAEEKTAKDLVEQFGQYDPKLDLSSYVYPHLDLLENHRSNKISVSTEELEANKNKIVETLNNYNIEIDKIKATIGPTVTLYEIIPAPGVRISKIKNLEDDIALSLAALGIRIIAPMPGKGTIGIEVPNQQPEMVAMRSVMATEKFQNTHMDLPIALGKTISNEVYIADLAKMPHLLVAGATGQGKSVGINAILVSLLYKLHPSQLKFVLVDPKKVELTLFKKIERHFLAKLPGEEDAIITDTKKVINTLNSLCIEMDQRYDLLKNGHVRNLKEYNQKFINRRLNPEEGHRFLPFIVLIVDEFADLMMTAGKEIETPIARLAQLARAVGIHLVIATQRPSVNIITGTIKANFPARLAFRVLSKIDSRTILDSGGADQLIGRGDMLLSTGSDLIRLQCAFVDTPEVERISDFIGEQRGYSSAWLLPEYVDESGEGGSVKDFDPNDRDPLFEDAARLIVLHQQGSTSLIQRKLKLGYNRAGRIIDQLEAAGVVGPFEGSKAREVLLPDDYALEQFLDNLNNE
ncbi:FtsK/SpoIIIE family DNA translocase [Arcticibacter tournemirensis]|uniref:DNA translocase FtsK n=1 Tax=Arcticibacter tournemirensis TaxID=699437 RepID=A0A4Q0MCJ7_9SPHI|nr:DNA translocase FtsK [Arcticibacter tournemirensis]RXF71077.1 DNA translocase FtsK [Arcticibacter tournemirensis]